jgi:Calcineurin-like phosphoesterase
MAARRLALSLLLAWSAAACGSDQTPAAPTPTPPSSPAVIAVSVSPNPLVAVADPGGVSERYRVTANLTFKETGGTAVRITALKVTVSSTAPPAWSVASTSDVSITVDAKGTALYTLPTTFDAAAADPSAQWQLDATATDAEGKAVGIAPVRVALTVPPRAVSAAVLVGAGDVDGCGRLEPEYTARLLDRIPGTVFVAGDATYPSGTLDTYQNCYGPTWGRHLWRTLAVPGNHDVMVDGGSAFFAYFGSAAGPAGLGYFSHTLGTWHIVLLNSNLPAQAGSPQYEWLRQDLAASTAACTVAVWHHPLYSSGQNGNSTFMRDAFNLMYQYGGDVVLNGDDHLYERFAPQDANGRASARGVREFVVGTGGYPLYQRGTPQPNSEVFENHTFGVLKLTLKSGSYDWEFVPVDGQTFRDAGSATCVVPSLR